MKITHIIIDWLVILAIWCLALWLIESCHAANVQLSWIASTDTNVTNYRLYAWTNSPDSNCLLSNAVQVATVGNVSGASVSVLVPAQYTFAATSIAANATQTNESAFSNFAYYDLPPPPTFLITVQDSTNLIRWNTTPIFFRLQITNGP